MGNNMVVTSITNIKKDLENKQNILEGFDLTRPIYQYTYLDKNKKEVSAITYGDEIKFSEIVESYDNYLKKVKKKHIKSSRWQSIKYLGKKNIKWIPLYVFFIVLSMINIPFLQFKSIVFEKIFYFFKILIPLFMLVVKMRDVNSNFGFKSFNKIKKWLKDEKKLEKFKSYFKEKEKVNLLQLEVQNAILDREKKVKEIQNENYQKEQQKIKDETIALYRKQYETMPVNVKLYYYEQALTRNRRNSNFQPDIPKFLEREALMKSILEDMAIQDLEIKSLYEQGTKTVNQEKTFETRNKDVIKNDFTINSNNTSSRNIISNQRQIPRVTSTEIKEKKVDRIQVGIEREINFSKDDSIDSLDARNKDVIKETTGESEIRNLSYDRSKLKEKYEVNREASKTKQEIFFEEYPLLNHDLLRQRRREREDAIVLERYLRIKNRNRKNLGREEDSNKLNEQMTDVEEFSIRRR